MVRLLADLLALCLVACSSGPPRSVSNNLFNFSKQPLHQISGPHPLF